LLLLDSLVPEKARTPETTPLLMEDTNLMNTGGVYVEKPAPQSKKLPWQAAEKLTNVGATVEERPFRAA
jgi:hypothetical protein